MSKGGKSSGNDNNSGGCFLTTACTEAKGLPDNCIELETLRHFRDNYMMNTPDGKADIAHYYKMAPSIVNAINNSPDAKKYGRVFMTNWYVHLLN